MIQSCRCRSQSRNGCFLLPRPASEVNPGIFNQRRPFEQPFQGRSFLVCEPPVFQLERLTEDFQKFLYPIAGGLHGLSDFLYQLIGRRSMQMKLMLACAFSHDAKLLILDEPTSGLDPLTRDEFLEILQDYIRDGQRSVLFSTHITTDLERVADYITLINRGNMIFTGSMEDLLSSYRLIKGKPCDLTADLEKNILGLRKTAMGFEGLITANAAVQYKHCVLDTATIDDIIICIGKGGTKA